MGSVSYCRWSMLSLSSRRPLVRLWECPAQPFLMKGWAKGGLANQQSAVYLGVAKGIRTLVQPAEWPGIPVAVVA